MVSSHTIQELLAHDLLIVEWAVIQHEKGLNVQAIQNKYTQLQMELLKKESVPNENN